MHKNKVTKRRMLAVRLIMLGCLLMLLASPAATPASFASNNRQDEELGLLCALSPEFFIGQPHEYPGGTSGIVRSVIATQDLGLVDYNTFFDEFDDLKSDISQGMFDPSQLDVDVAILILDDFSVRRAQNQNMSHGDYVFAVAQQILSAQFPSPDFSQLTPGASREVQYLDGHIRLIAVDGPYYNLHLMSDTMSAIVDQLRQQAQATNRQIHFIVNMSFAAFDCDWLTGMFGRETVREGDDYPFLHDHDMIVPFDQLSSPPDPMRPEDQTLWQVVDANSQEFMDAGLGSGGVIEAFEFPAADPDLQVWLSLNADSLLGHLISVGDNTNPVGLRTTDGDEFWVSPLALYKALLGDSVAMRSAEWKFVVRGLTPDQILPRMFAAELEQERAFFQQELLDQPALMDPPGPFDPFPGGSGSISYVIPVAAAGNFDGIEPLYPASLSAVISVAGSITQQQFDLVLPSGMTTQVTLDPEYTRWPDSNSGQLMAPAGWYSVSCDRTELCSGEYPEYVSGTSFAAPAASVLIGLSLLRGCDPALTAGIAAWPIDHTFFDQAYCP